MTALTKYQRLEASALWRDRPGARAREVILGLREATVILSDPRSEMPLAQWSLPAIARLNPGEMPARFAPGADAGEEVEITDPDMIEALATVHKALERRKPRPGRLRGVILGATALAVVGVVVFWLPGQVKSYTAKVLPVPTREDLGAGALADLARLTGQPCKSVPGRRAAERLAERLFPDAPPRIEVLREGLAQPAALPGNLLLLPAALIETADAPDTIAGHLLVQAETAKDVDPTDPLLAYVGLGATLRLLTTGSLPADAVKGYGERFLAAVPPPVPATERLTAAFHRAQVSSASYAAAIRDSGLMQQDPYPLGAPLAVMSDESWLQLQAICSE